MWIFRLLACKKRLDDRHIRLDLDDKAKDWLAKNGYDSEFGARPLKRLIQQELENPLAMALLSGDILDHSVVAITVQDDKLVFNSATKPKEKLSIPAV